MRSEELELEKNDVTGKSCCSRSQCREAAVCIERSRQTQSVCLEDRKGKSKPSMLIKCAMEAKGRVLVGVKFTI